MYVFVNGKQNSFRVIRSHRLHTLLDTIKLYNDFIFILQLITATNRDLKSAWAGFDFRYHVYKI